MASTKQSVSLSVKNGAGTYSTNAINHSADNDSILQFAKAYNALQASEAEAFIKKTAWLVTP